MPVEKNNKVTIEYKGKLENGEVFDASAKHGKPLEFVTGLKMMIPGFENAVIGMEKDEEKEISLEPKDAYGEYNEELKKEIPRNVLPPDQEPKEGMIIGMQTPQGQIPLKIIKVTPENITVDMNHPMAGKKLNFKIKVLSYEKVDVEKMMKDMQEQMQVQAQANHEHNDNPNHECCKDENCTAEKCGEEGCECIESNKTDSSASNQSSANVESLDSSESKTPDSIEDLAEGK
ncbi:peptidylprolyl isomerase [archaeon]|jgi:FKBP-type peptidyl-prolyl cis-trans isomerase 2|nr:peptidylprolyl isomerase [archaeon]MBT4241333.1 peptidylprolyl isomerase [archaeon]MBT4418154.1 peptidylprolyl isomerase [archaeon]